MLKRSGAGRKYGKNGTDPFRHVQVCNNEVFTPAAPADTTAAYILAQLIQFIIFVCITCLTLVCCLKKKKVAKRAA